MDGPCPVSVEQLRQAVDAQRDDALALLQQLVAQPSLLGHEAQLRRR